MILRRSQFIHQVRLAPDRVLIVHAIRHTRLAVDHEVNAVIDYFAVPRRIPEDCQTDDCQTDDHQTTKNAAPYSSAIARLAVALAEHGILTEETPEQELATVQAELSATHGRDPTELLDRYRSKLAEGVTPYWTVESARKVTDFTIPRQRVDALLIGECDIQMEADFLRKEADRRGIDLHVSATFPDDTRAAAERKYEIILVGALRARQLLMAPPIPGQHVHLGYVAQVRKLLEQLREKTQAPILVDNLPDPTVEPLGLAERGISGHRTRFRLTNVALAEVAAGMSDVHVVDVAAALAASGSVRMLDDGLIDFTHLGSPGWLLQRPESEKTAVHGIFPDMTPLAAWVDGDPYLRERSTAEAHIDALATALGVGRKKCVIVDLDGILWPGVLAETGSPFAWSPDVSGIASYAGLYFGIHEALLCLKKRGIVLACVSKNDESVVRELWKYGSHYPHQRLLTLDDFAVCQINWSDKVDNIVKISQQLGFALDAFLFVDDHPVERDRVHQRLPEVEVWGENLFSLRRMLLKDPRLQLPAVTEASSTRTALVKMQIERQQLRAEMDDEESYLASLHVECRVEQLVDALQLPRVVELFQRTTQCNTSGRRFTANELDGLLSNPAAQVLALYVSDRFGDQGLAGAAVIVESAILGFVISCRVLGMGVEHKFMQHILARNRKTLTGMIVETSRNMPVRNVYRDHGFLEVEPGVWRLESRAN